MKMYTKMPRDKELPNNEADYEWAFGLNRLSLRLMGIWPEDGEVQKQSFGTIYRVPFMVLTMFAWLVLPQLGALFLVMNELPLVVDNLMTSCAALTSCIKLFFLWRSKQVLQPVVRSVRRDWLELGWQAEPSSQRAPMVHQASRARLFTVSGYVILAGCYSGFAFAPLFGIDIRIISNITDPGDRHLLVQSYFPYDYTDSPSYELTQLLQLLAGFFVGMSVSIPDNYFAALVFHASAQFEILGLWIENCLVADDAADSGDFRRRLKILVDRHVHLIANVTAVERSFSYVIVAQVFCMTIMVCCLGFQIISMFGNNSYEPSPLQILTLVGTLFTLMMHTLVDCFACETLAFYSNGIFYSTYKCRWYTRQQANTRDLIPVMMMSRLPQKLTAGKLFHLSLATYCNILKSAAGYISMLIAVSGK